MPRAYGNSGFYPYAPWLGLDRSAQDRNMSDLPAHMVVDATPPARASAYNMQDDLYDPSPRLRDRDALPVIPQSLNVPRMLGGADDVAATFTQDKREAPSAIETMYARRISDELNQFGYDLFRHMDVFVPYPERASRRDGLPAGTVQDDFVLSAGDALQILWRGQRNETGVHKIDSQGRLILDKTPPIPAAGRTLGQVRDTLNAYASTQYNQRVFVSLDAVRQIDVLVVGNVKRPGRQTLTVFNSVLDALEQAGGIDKSGSLRQIKLIRGGRSTLVDLYALLVHGSVTADLNLRDGDRIMVPPVGATIAVAGNVKRPGIYELPYSAQRLSHRDALLSLNEMLELAGGVLAPGRNRFMKLSLTPDGRETNIEVSEPYQPAFGDGSILMVAASREARTDTVELSGHTRAPGMHALSTAPNLSALIDHPRIFGPDIYPLIGLIERNAQDQMTREWISFPPLLVAQGQFDRNLNDGDVVHLFSRTQIHELMNPALRKKRSILDHGSVDPESETDLPITDPVMRDALKEHAIFVRGAVRQEGAWPAAQGATLAHLVAAAGGLSLEAGTENIEITSGTKRIAVNYAQTNPDTVMLKPGDTVRINQKFIKTSDQSVLLSGQVMRPGRYDLMPGEKLSDLLERAGGLTPQAYPDGAIFSRMSERRAEEMRFRAQARQLELKLASTLEQTGKDMPNMNQVGAVQGLIGELNKAEGIGRITVESDPGTLAARPELDILLEAGDRIHIPQRPLTVRVAGEVLSPASLQFRERKAPRDYIMQAGGFTYHADKNRAFVVYPDGSAQPLQVSTWNHTSAFIPPGSTIIVPRDPKPFDFIETARDVSQILSNLAITGIFLDDIRKD